MPDLIAKTALDGRSLTLAGLALTEIAPRPITSVAVYPGGMKAVARGLKALGLGFPAPNRFADKGAARILWTGRDQAFLIGPGQPALEGAALTDQSDGWATLGLGGAGAAETLARLTPIDLRPAAFPVGGAARSQLNHMQAIFLRTGAEAFEIMVFRSMARTAWHEIEAAMAMLAARAALKS